MVRASGFNKLARHLFDDKWTGPGESPALPEPKRSQFDGVHLWLILIVSTQDENP